MKGTIQSEFSFINFQVLKSEIEHSLNENLENVEIEISPKGKFFKNEKTYSLFLDLHIIRPNKSTFIKMKCVANFRFVQEFEVEDIPNYFTLNAPAIAYPYMRSYISALSALSGLDTVYLPIMNLVSLKEELIKNFEVVEN
uniref:hypothetical protein n=1 Tax=Fulvivirga sp. TaxID=1931237 RepID=UPI0040490F1E